MTTHPDSFVAILTGGHPNSLGRTIELVDLILTDKTKLEELYQCYFDDDEVVRLRTSNAFKRITKVQPDWALPYIDKFLAEISQIKQASTQWTLAWLLLELGDKLTPEQKHTAKTILQHNLTTWEDWIVLNNTIETLGAWAKQDNDLKTWLLPHLERLTQDTRKSVAGRAQKMLVALTTEKTSRRKKTK